MSDRPANVTQARAVGSFVIGAMCTELGNAARCIHDAVKTAHAVNMAINLELQHELGGMVDRLIEIVNATRLTHFDEMRVIGDEQAATAADDAIARAIAHTGSVVCSGGGGAAGGAGSATASGSSM